METGPLCPRGNRLFPPGTGNVTVWRALWRCTLWFGWAYDTLWAAESKPIIKPIQFCRRACDSERKAGQGSSTGRFGLEYAHKMMCGFSVFWGAG